MKREDIFKRIAAGMWENEIVSQHNYNYDYVSFEKEIIELLKKLFEDYVIVSGNIIK